MQLYFSRPVRLSPVLGQKTGFVDTGKRGREIPILISDQIPDENEIEKANELAIRK